MSAHSWELYEIKRLARDLVVKTEFCTNCGCYKINHFNDTEYQGEFLRVMVAMKTPYEIKYKKHWWNFIPLSKEPECS